MRRIITTAALAAALLVPGSLSASADAPDVEDVIDGLDFTIEVQAPAGMAGRAPVFAAPSHAAPPITALNPETFYPASPQVVEGVGDANLYHAVEVSEKLTGFINAEAVQTYRSGPIDAATLTEPATATRAEVVYAAAVQDVRQGLYGEGEDGELREGDAVHTASDVDRLFEGMLPVRTSDGMVGWVSEGAIALDTDDEPVEPDREGTTTEPAEGPEPEEPAGDAEPVTEAPHAAADTEPAERSDPLPVGLLVGLGAGVLVVGGLAVARARSRSQRAASTEPAVEDLTYDDGDDAIEELVYEDMEDDR